MTTETPAIAIVTGASQGIGRATAELFLERGWRIVTCARGAVEAEALRHPGWVAHIPTDLSVRAETRAFVDKALEALAGAPVAALVNNAAVSPKTPFKERLGVLNGAVEQWETVFELNFFAPLLLARGFASDLTKTKGAVVNLTSIAGHLIHPFAGSAYSVSKSALSGLTREMAGELGQLGIRVNAVAPGEIETAMVSADYENLVPRIPLQRMGAPRDVAETIVWLCDPASGYVSGAEIFVTGGQHLY